MNERPKTKLVNCGALWKGKAGSKVLLSGTVDLPNGSKLRIKMFKNENKREEKHPDYRLVTDVPLDEDAAIAEAKEVFRA